jgi:hypothetical protein
MEFIAIFSNRHDQSGPAPRDPLTRHGSSRRDPGERDPLSGPGRIIRFDAPSLDGARRSLDDLPIVQSGIVQVQVFPLISVLPGEARLAPN